MAKPNPSVGCNGNGNGNGCPSGEVATDCCDCVPETLVAVGAAEFPDCTCFDGDEGDITWNGSSWTGSITASSHADCDGGGTIDLELKCDGGTWKLKVTGCVDSGGFVCADESQCDPTGITFNDVVDIAGGECSCPDGQTTTLGIDISE